MDNISVSKLLQQLTGDTMHRIDNAWPERTFATVENILFFCQHKNILISILIAHNYKKRMEFGNHSLKSHFILFLFGSLTLI